MHWMEVVGSVLERVVCACSRTWWENEARGPRNATRRGSMMGVLEWKYAILDRMYIRFR